MEESPTARSSRSWLQSAEGGLPAHLISQREWERAARVASMGKQAPPPPRYTSSLMSRVTHPPPYLPPLPISSSPLPPPFRWWWSPCACGICRSRPCTRALRRRVSEWTTQASQATGEGGPLH